MTELTKAEKAGMAKDLLNSPLLIQILDDIEKRALDTVINADPGEHEKRANFALQVRAIRELRSKLKSCLDDNEYKPKTVA